MRVIIYVEKPQTSGDQSGEKEPVTGDEESGCTRPQHRHQAEPGVVSYCPSGPHQADRCGLGRRLHLPSFRATL